MAAAIPIRLATPADAAGCLAIYAPFVTGTTTSFETEVPTVAEFANRIESTLQSWPWLVATASPTNDACLGYAYATRHRERSGYRWSVETSLYVAQEHRRTGTGRQLYEMLFDCLRLQGFYNAYAGITLPNDASVAFHTALGFREVGVYENIGFKQGAWHSVGWWQLRLRDGVPSPPRTLADCRTEIDARLG